MQAWAALLAGLVSPADPCQASWPCFRPLPYLDELLGAGVKLHGQLGLQSGGALFWGERVDFIPLHKSLPFLCWEEALYYLVVVLYHAGKL